MCSAAAGQPCSSSIGPFKSRVFWSVLLVQETCKERDKRPLASRIPQCLSGRCFH